MWVRIREIRFPGDRADEVIDHVRDTAVARFVGDGHLGFRLLMDRLNGRALEVSYWRSEQDARAQDQLATADVADVPGGVVERTSHYELAIDGG